MTVNEIHQEIEQTSERRTELWHVLSQGYDPSAAQELKSLSERLDHLWDEEHIVKAELRGCRQAFAGGAPALSSRNE